jgi:2-oxoglutarate dehydrogenase E1 component
MSSRPVTGAFNDGYIADLYETYRRDPNAVDEGWRQFFGMAESLAGSVGGGMDPSLLRKAAGAGALVGAIERYGHLAVQLDPLGSPPPGAPELTPAFHGITDEDLESIPASALGSDEDGTAAEVVQRVRERFCGNIAFEFDHIDEESERQWFRHALWDAEIMGPLTPDERRWLLQRLTEVDGLERFLGIAFVNAKRFSIEGVDVLVPMLDEAISRAVRGGARRVVIGMAHRGRLNVLTHVMSKPYRELLEEFEGHHSDTNAPSESGDVKYHMGYYSQREIPGVGTVDVELVPNPSHLEFVNPVVMGVTRARQRMPNSRAAQRDQASVLPITVHGDASFPGEGIVAETLNISLLKGFRVGGTLHVMLNNQVGFTTNPADSRSTYYASDLAKGYDIPIVHINGDDPEASIQAVRLGIAYRERFGKDFLIDVVGYRRHGHNEADQPSFTQPLMYKAIAQHPSVREVWRARVVAEGLMAEEDTKAAEAAVSEHLQETYREMMKELERSGDTAEHGTGRPMVAEAPSAVETAVRPERLVSLNEQLLTWPSTFKLHPTIARTLPRRREALNNNGIDWGHAEALAFASLLADGVNIRMSGQDVERGTFSHRQAVLHDMNTGETYTPLGNLPQAKASFEIYNSPLSETAVLGFEYGFSTAVPSDLVLWEAQFGDFANVAQPIIDQFIAADRAKWGQDSNLVLLLPHGYEGQGPEHSSARLERFLQLVAEGNLTVAYPSTPGQYFHILRRQALCTPCRPLVLMQPKSLLRLPAAASSLDELTAGTFQPVIDDPVASHARERIQRLVFCTGKLYYDLIAAGQPANIAIVRIEELAPWSSKVGDIADLYANVEEVVWAQEEPKNMGAWTYVQPRLRASVGTLIPLRYLGRPERASPAEGYKNWHDAEQARIIRDVLTYTPATKRKASASR